MDLLLIHVPLGSMEDLMYDLNTEFPGITELFLE